MSTCFHCSLPSAPEFRAPIKGIEQDFCCLGCQAVAITIVEGGLSHFYTYRDQPSQKPEQKSGKVSTFDAYNLPEVQADFVTAVESPATSLKRAAFSIDGITCAACVWLLEKHLGKLAGISKVVINASSHQGTIEFDSLKIKPSDIFTAFDEIGFTAFPNVGQTAQKHWQQRQRTALLRLGVAGIGMMQAGMVSVALHAGTMQGISGELQNLLRWSSLVMASPVLLYSAFPFFTAAWRALRARHLIMDVPVSLALILAFLASCYATIFETGEVYFDSVAMFTFFLLLGRYLEQRVRYRNFLRTGRLQQLLPLTVDRREGDTFERIPLKSLKSGDTVNVGAGETFPCDGVVVAGQSSADESLLTGESRPQLKSLNGRVVAGSQNIESAIEVRATAVAEQTRLAAIEQLIDQAAEEKPAQVILADKVASLFVAAVLVVATGVAGFWLIEEPAKALWVTLSVLVVTCPCALSLATPTALTSALHATRQKGILMTSGIALESVAKVTDVIFDKTGTLTEGKLTLADIQVIAGDYSEAQVLGMIAAIQQVSHHPIATAFAAYSDAQVAVNATNLIGQGVEGQVGYDVYRVGKIAFCCPNTPVDYPSAGLWVAFSQKVSEQNFKLIAWVRLNDHTRDSTRPCLQALQEKGIRLHLLSGDREANVVEFAEGLPFSSVHAEQSPQAKLAFVQNLQQAQKKVLMVGDGINDVPVLTAADVSIAMNQSSDIAKLQADAVLLNDDLLRASNLFDLSRQVRKIIRQNMAWALGYNLCALPLAAAGFIPPWLAAIGMSASSLIVVLNALRLTR